MPAEELPGPLRAAPARHRRRLRPARCASGRCAEQEAIARAALTARSDGGAGAARQRGPLPRGLRGRGHRDRHRRPRRQRPARSTTRCTRMFGGSRQHVRSRKVSEWVHPDDAPQRLAALRRTRPRRARALPRREAVLPRRRHGAVDQPDGLPAARRRRHARSTSSPCMEDITERRLLNLRLRYEATHDALTGLPNRTLFFERLEKALAARARRSASALCYLDLDGFKAVNDSLGHAAGDRLLVEVADRLQGCATAPGEMVARLGGDEFVALATGPRHRARGRRTRRPHPARAARPRSASTAASCTVRGSIGIVEGPAGERGRGGGAAQRRHHDVPGQGGGRQPLRARRRRGRRPRHHPARADQRRCPTALDRGEFFIEYQPLVHLGDGSVRGAEALVRWLHPQHGVLGPDQFIPLAEHTGLIVPLGRWVLEQAVRQARDWQERHDGRRRPLRINVNLSPLPAAPTPAWSPDTVDVLERAGLEPERAVPGGHRVGADRRRRGPLQAAAPARRDGRGHRPGRLRHRLLEPRQPAPAAGERPQARPLLHPGHAAASRPTRSTSRSSRASSRSPTAWTSRSRWRAWRPARRPSSCGCWAATPPRAGTTPARARPERLHDLALADATG